MMNFQSMIASKASRVVNAARGRDVVEFGSRRAHGPQAALLAARASFIGGCAGTSNALAARLLGIPAFGTMAHSFVMSFESELRAFQEFARVFPDGLLLVDTYDTIAAVKKIVEACLPARGIRLDSGDLYALSVESRRILDGAGYTDSVIMASGDLNEHVIHELVSSGAPIDSFGVGTELVTSRDDPAMNGVYKLVAIRLKDGTVVHKLKESPGKKTYPGPKQVYRSVKDGVVSEDVIALEEEEELLPEGSVPLLKKYMAGGRIVRGLPSIQRMKEFHRQKVATLPAQFTDIFTTADTFPVRFSKQLEQAAMRFQHGR